MKESNIYLYGSGGHAKVIADILRFQRQTIAGFIDDDPAKVGSHICGMPVMPSKQLSKIRPSESKWIVAIGNNEMRLLSAITKCERILLNG